MSVRILELRVSNVKRVALVELKPDGSVVVIGGRNESGKSSTLDAIQMALSGGRSHCKQPIRNGAKRGEVVVKLSGDESRGLKPLTVRRTWTPKATQLVVTSDGNKLGSPQAVLDELFSHLSFDPCAFLRYEPKKQLETLRNVIGLDTSDLDARRESVYEQRRDINRDAKRVEAQLEDCPPLHEDAPDAEQSIEELMRTLTEIEAHNARVAEKNRAVEQARKALQGVDDEIESLESRLKELRDQREGVVKTLADALSEADDDLLDTQPVREKITHAETINRQVRENAHRRELQWQLDALLSDASELTAELESLDEQKRDRIASAQFPIDGLSLDDDGVLYNGVPLEQISQAQGLQVSAAIGAALNPACSVMLIRDGSWLDDVHLKQFVEIAEQRGLQVFLERVGTGEECQVILEDGHVKEAVSS